MIRKQLKRKRKDNFLVPKYFRLLFIFYIIGNIIQILVYVHSVLGGAAKYDGYYAPFPIMVFEALLWFIAGIYNLSILIITLFKRSYGLWHIPVLNSTGFIINLIPFLVSILNYDLYIQFVAPFQNLALYIYLVLKLLSVYFAISIVRKFKV